MALKALMLKRSIEMKNQALEELRAKDEDFQTREAELETAIGEAGTDEEQAAVAEEVDKFEADKETHEKAKSDLAGEIAELERQLAEAEQDVPAPKTEPKREKENKKMENRTKFFGMSMEERNAFFADEQVKNFLSEVRTCIKEKRALTNAGLLIPEVALDLLKEQTEKSSKLLKYVNVKRVGGNARQRIMGAIPEAVWTEACATLNELSLGFNDVEVDGFKVGGYFAVCNAVLEDNDVNLMSEILTALGTAIGKALDKAIVFGTGVKMPLGFVTRLAQTEEPSTYPATSRTWADLHTSNVLTGTGATGLNLFKEIATNSGCADNQYASNMVWIMNHKTHTKLLVNSMDKNANAAIVAGMNNTMPVIGGDIVELSFMEDNDIAFGYLDAYLLAERAGTALAQSDQYKFVEDQTIFKGTARYDGTPAIAEAFGILSIDSGAPATTATFASDAANA